MKIAKIVFICIFCLCISIVPLILQLCPIKVDLEEKRDPTAFPTEYSDDYFAKVNDWYSDHSPMRDPFIWVYNQFDEKVEKPFFEALARTEKHDPLPIIYPIDDDASYPYPYLDTLVTDYYPLKTKNRVIYGRDEWLFFTGDNSLDYYTGANIKTEEEMSVDLQALQDLTDWGKGHGVNIVMLIAPNKEQVYADKMPSVQVEHPAKYLLRFRRLAKQNYNVQLLYPLEELIDGRQTADTYLMQDTHWNEYGAYLAYKELLPYLDLTEPGTPTISTYQIQGGDLAHMLGIGGQTYQTGTASVESEVVVNIQNIVNGYYEEYDSDLDDDSHLYLIGDSFRTRLLYYLSHHYDKVSAIHFNYSNPNNPNKRNYTYYQNMMANLKPGDTIVIEIVERYMVNLNFILPSILNSASSAPAMNS